MTKIKTGRFAIVLLSVFAIAFVAPASSAFSAEKSTKPIPVCIAIVSKSILDLPFWVARDRGFYRDEGLEAEIVFMRSNLTLQAMTSGSIDFGAATGAAVNAIVSGVDLRVVMAMSDRPMFDWSRIRASQVFSSCAAKKSALA